MASDTGPSEDLWDTYKDIIIDHYLQPKAKLSDVILTMSNDYEFEATKFQYEAHFKKWKIRKNLSKTEWLSLIRILEKRKAEGKSSEVYLNGQCVPTKKIRREQLRYGFKSFDKDRKMGSFCVPDGIEIRSPVQSPISLDNEVSDTLPDFHLFQEDNAQQMTSFDSRAALELQIGSLETSAELLHDASYESPLNAIFYDTDFSQSPMPVTNIIGTPRQIIQYPEATDAFHVYADSSSNSLSKETFSNTLGQYLTGRLTAPNWVNTTGWNHGATKRLKLNNEIQKDVLCRSALLPIRGIEFSFINTLRFSVLNNAAGLGDQFVVQGLQRITVNSLLRFPRSTLVTEGIIDFLIRQAIELGDLNLISTLNDLSGSVLDPNEFICVSGGCRYTPLERATILYHVELVRALVVAGANPNKSHSNTSPLARVLKFFLIPQDQNLIKENLKSIREIVKVLVNAGAKVTPDIVENASFVGDMQIYAALAVAVGWKLFTYTYVDTWRDNGYPLMNCAKLWCESPDQDFIIATLRSMAESFPLRGSEEFADAYQSLQFFLSSAIEYERYDVMQCCRSLGASFRSIDLVLALSNGAIELSDTIIGSGVDINACFGYEYDSFKPYHPNGAFRRPARGCVYQHKQEGNFRKLSLHGGKNCESRFRTTAFAEALRLEDAGKKIYDTLEQKGALTNALSDVRVFQAILAAAAESGNLCIVSRLLNMFIDAEHTIKDQKEYFEAANYCFQLSIANHQREIQRCFISSGFGTNKNGKLDMGVIHTAVSQHNFEIIDYMMGFGELCEESQLYLWLEAIRCGDHFKIMSFATRGLRLDRISPPLLWKTLFYYHQQDYKLVELLISLGAPVNPLGVHVNCTDYFIPGGDSRGALEVAASMANPGMVKCLLDLGVNSFDSRALTCATLSCKESVPFLIENFMRRHPEGELNFGSPALKYAIISEDLPLIQAIAGVANVNGYEDFVASFKREEDFDSCLPCPISMEKETWEDINRQIKHKSPLGTAVTASLKNELAIVGILLDAGADPNLNIEVGRAPDSVFVPRTALMAAIRAENLELIHLLIAYGADINRHADLRRYFSAERETNTNNPADSPIHRTPLQYAVKIGNSDIVKWLLQNGADVNAGPGISCGVTALQAASACGWTSIIHTLLEFGADVNAKPSRFHGGTALQMAARFGHFEVVKKLLEIGAKVNDPGSDFYGRTALQFATAEGWFGIVEMLLERGADINAVSSKFTFRTALQLAAQNGRFSIVELLIKQGTKLDPSQIPKAIYLAKQEQHNSIAKYLTKIHEKRQSHQQASCA